RGRLGWQAGFPPVRTGLRPAYFVVQSARKQPAHAEHIDGGTKSAITQAILTLAEATRTMIHGNFHKPVSGGFDKRRDETVHAFEWDQGAHTFPPHCLQRAAGVADAIFCKTAANEIGDPAG